MVAENGGIDREILNCLNHLSMLHFKGALISLFMKKTITIE